MLKQYLQGEINGRALSSGEAVDYKIAEKLYQSEISTDMKLRDAFLLSVNCEKVSHEFYLGLAGVHPDGKVKN